MKDREEIKEKKMDNCKISIMEITSTREKKGPPRILF